MTLRSQTLVPSSAPPPHPPGPPSAPPEWAMEMLVKRLGALPAAAGRALDRLAKVPVLGHVVRFFSSVWLGISILFLIGVYIAIGSGFPSLRAAREKTDLQFFDDWPMLTLLACLALDLSIVTLRRIPLTLFKLGPWTVHIGILTLITGCVWYFSLKQEGSVRIYLNQTADCSYDVTERALYAYRIDDQGRADTAHATMTSLPGLPIYNEHVAEIGNPLHFPVPATALTALDPALKGATLTITGYYPYAEWRQTWTADPAASTATDPPNPALHLGLSIGDMSLDHWLIGLSPKDRVMEGADLFAFEYLYHPTPTRLAEITAPLDGAVGLTVRVPKFNVTRTYSIKDQNPIAIEGTPYTIAPGQVGEMPLISKGYEGATSSTLDVIVTRKDGDQVTTFRRMALSRYPERSPDFIKNPDGTEKRIQDRTDNDIEIVFHDAAKDQIWLVENADASLEMIVRHAGGKVERTPLQLRNPAALTLAGHAAHLTVRELTPRAVRIPAPPEIVPAQFRQRGLTAMDALQTSIIEMQLAVGGRHYDQIYVPFVEFAQVGDPPGRQPTVVNIAGVGKIGLLLSTTRRPLPAAVTLTAFKAVKYPGAINAYEDYLSHITFKDPQTGQAQPAVAQLNHPASYAGLYFFQAMWDGDDNAPPEKRFTVLGVANRPGIPVMVAGALLIVLGIGYAFYIKPILLRAKRAQVIRWNAQRTAGL